MTPQKLATIKLAANLGIFLFGCSAVWLIGRPEPWRRWGYILALCSQPFWLLMAFVQQDWGVFFISWVYAYSWAQGVWFHWIKAETVEPENATPLQSVSLSGSGARHLEGAS